MTNLNDRVTTLALDSAQTVLDAADLLEKQNRQLVNAFYGTVESNQQAVRDLTTKVVRQTQEAQLLWLQLAQESFRTTAETFARVTETQIEELGKQVETVSQQVANGVRKTQPEPKIVTPAK